MAHSRAAASAALHTPTDLSADATSAIIEVLNPLVADALLLYVKTKNFHWHVTGPSQLGFEIGAHALRATAATNALDHQADIAKVQEWLGHANIATTRIYDHPKTRPEDSPSGDIWP
jgi:DNA-binding ferritin-like protein